MLYRQTIVAFLLSMYGLAAVGMPVHYHTCNGDLKHISLFGDKEVCTGHTEATHSRPACCADGFMADHCSTPEVDQACCQVKSEWHKVDTPVILNDSGDVLPTLADCPGFDRHVPPADVQPVHSETPFLSSPVPDRYLMHCALIFYG